MNGVLVHGFLIHTIAFNYPEEPSKEDKQKFKNFIYSLGDVLPCKYCKPAFNKYLEEIPMEPYLKDRKVLLIGVI